MRSSAAAMRLAAVAVRRRACARYSATTRMPSRLHGFIHALMAGDAVLSRFQSSLATEQVLHSYTHKQTLARIILVVYKTLLINY